MRSRTGEPGSSGGPRADATGDAGGAEGAGDAGGAGIEAALVAHDRAVAAHGLEIWLGGEPTFTDRFSRDAEWNGAALGDDKRARGARVAAAIARARPGAALIRALGRQYPGGDTPRWCFGVYARRDGTPVWTGPPDPLLGPLVGGSTSPLIGGGTGGPGDAPARDAARALRDALCARLGGIPFDTTGALPHRFVVTPGRDASDASDANDQRGQDDANGPSDANDANDANGQNDANDANDANGQNDATGSFAALPAHLAENPELMRPPLGSVKTPPDGPRDPLAERGVLLVAIGVEDGAVRVDLPMIADAGEYQRWLAAIAAAAAGPDGAARPDCLDCLILAGFPPPVDASVWWSTATPDPGVLELNMAPEPSVRDYYRELRRVHALAAEQALSPRRLYFNGDATESGGGGHLTLGGSSPAVSPWFREPRLLPRLIAYFNRHPSLSYAFAPAGVGSSGQFPRPDETTREAFGELSLAVDALARVPAASPAALWAAFAPLLADRFGNTHRCEINVEKLWNPYLPGRGKLGVVELRAMRMTATPERAAAVAALFRAIAGYAAITDVPTALIDWGAELHDRFALPAFLRRDLGRVLADLHAAGLGLDPVLEAILLDDDERVIGRANLGDAELTVRRALEFWPLVGDLSQEVETSRTIDASVARIELSVRGAGRRAGDGAGRDRDAAAGWEVIASGHRAPLVAVGDDTDERVLGVRYRRFAPARGLHPSVPPRDPLELWLVRHPDTADAVDRTGRARVRLRLYDWIPGGGIYDGIPANDAEAARRRAERFVLDDPDRDDRDDRDPAASPPRECPLAPAGALTRHTLDTRRL